MQKFFGIEVHTETMTLEELLEARKKTQEILANLEHQILIRQKAKHKYSSYQSTPR